MSVSEPECAARAARTVEYGRNGAVADECWGSTAPHIGVGARTVSRKGASMRERVRVPRAMMVIAAVLAVGAGAACGSSNGSTNPGLTPAELVGTYSLVSLTLGNSAPLTPPTATGTLALTSSTYNLTLMLPSGTQQDSGTWTVSGHQWTQTSSSGQGQEQGTVSLSHDTLSVDLTAAGTAISTVWVMVH